LRRALCRTKQAKIAASQIGKDCRVRTHAVAQFKQQCGAGKSLLEEDLAHELRADKWQRWSR